uniref:Uncharacterized protein n=1 Tax=Megaselia scalaris TaxID=36166 RepID=T1GAX5_MEGSC
MFPLFCNQLLYNKIYDNKNLNCHSRVNFGLNTIKSGFRGLHYVIGVLIVKNLLALGLFYAFKLWAIVRYNLIEKSHFSLKQSADDLNSLLFNSFVYDPHIKNFRIAFKYPFSIVLSKDIFQMGKMPFYFILEQIMPDALHILPTGLWLCRVYSMY